MHFIIGINHALIEILHFSTPPPQSLLPLLQFTNLCYIAGIGPPLPQGEHLLVRARRVFVLRAARDDGRDIVHKSLHPMVSVVALVQDESNVASHGHLLGRGEEPVVVDVEVVGVEVIVVLKETQASEESVEGGGVGVTGSSHLGVVGVLVQ